MRLAAFALCALCLCDSGLARASSVDPPAATAPAAATDQATATDAPVAAEPSRYDPALAQRLGADERGMRRYVLVILRTGPTPMPEGPERKAMFAGHFANMERLVAEGKLVMAGPFASDPAGWRGLFLLAVDDIEQARQLASTDPVLVKGEMVAEYHLWYGSAAAMMLPEIHHQVAPPAP